MCKSVKYEAPLKWQANLVCVMLQALNICTLCQQQPSVDDHDKKTGDFDWCLLPIYSIARLNDIYIYLFVMLTFKFKQIETPITNCTQHRGTHYINANIHTCHHLCTDKYTEHTSIEYNDTQTNPNDYSCWFANIRSHSTR